MTQHCIRPIVLCIFRRGREVLVHEGYDPVKDRYFYRPLGGGIDFGEQSRDAAAREMKEELGADVCNLRYLGTLENIFTYDGNPGHEIVLIYEADFADSSVYERKEAPQAVESNGVPIKTVWVALDSLDAADALPLYPDGLLELLQRSPS